MWSTCHMLDGKYGNNVGGLCDRSVCKITQVNKLVPANGSTTSRFEHDVFASQASIEPRELLRTGNFDCDECDLCKMELFNIKFVGEVEKHPELYDYTRTEYSRKDCLEKAWNEVAKEVNLSGRNHF
ncbi:hypothetical protein ABEB36_015346 [Hypothenemus hampei]|uniref:MADF domain-containing protein n=1 Tax=Hypothenemus hampei TaxID=57062 RepID=A0ABD1E061_HYPHA